MTCAYCGDPDAPDVEHVIPLSRGGDRGPGNQVRACERCNGSKGGRTPREWLRAQPLQARIALYHARAGRPGQLALRLDIPEWWIDVRVCVDDDLWRAFGRACAGRRQGRHSALSRSAILRDFVKWYVREPGTKMPRRPGEPARERPGGTP